MGAARYYGSWFYRTIVAPWGIASTVGGVVSLTLVTYLHLKPKHWWPQAGGEVDLAGAVALNASWAVLGLVGLHRFLSVPYMLHRQLESRLADAEAERDEAMERASETLTPRTRPLEAIRYIQEASAFGIDRMMDGENWATNFCLKDIEMAAEAGEITIWGRARHETEHVKISNGYWINGQIAFDHLFSPLRARLRGEGRA